MESAVTPDTESGSTAEAEAAIAHVVEQIMTVRNRMKVHDAEIARIKAETNLLKEETRVLRDETRAILTGLRSAD